MTVSTLTRQAPGMLGHLRPLWRMSEPVSHTTLSEACSGAELQATYGSHPHAHST